MADLMFPKNPTKKRRRKNRKSILQSEKDKRCFLCMYLNEDYNIKHTEEHHVYDGSNRIHSTEYGMTVRLCIPHHREGKEAVHNNAENMRIIQRFGQEAFESEYGDREDFMKIFGRNFL